MTRGALLVAAGILFAILATANAAGYRYGTSDQAFYIPAVVRHLDPAAFPRDRPLIDAQATLIVVDDVLAVAGRLTGISLEAMFFSGYLVSIGLTWAALVMIGNHVYRSVWLTVALGAAFTMRHRIARTSANTFEPYFHPRMLAFALGMIAIGAVLKRRGWAAVALVGMAAIIHTTTALWFSVLLGVALVVLEPAFRRLAVVGAGAAILVLAWAASGGPLQNMLTAMDATWLQAVASKDSLFADQWPAWAWLTNLGTLGILLGAHAARRRRGTATREDGALVLGAVGLVALFLATLPFVVARVPLAVEFQISRVFWLIDLLATIYLLAALGDLRTRFHRSGSFAATLAAVLVAVSTGRAVYVGFVENPDRPLVALTLPPSPWNDAMQWVSRQPVDVHVLADPGHGWKYGSSVRVAASRDVLLEEVKDSALAIYSRSVAGRVVERTGAIGDFTQLTAEHARALADRYDLHLLVSDADLPLPTLYRNQQFRVYDLRRSLAAR